MTNQQLDHSQHQRSGIKYPLCLLAHDIDVPMNIGSLFRIADALGVEKIHLTGSSPVPPNSKIKKTSRSTEKYVAFAYERDPLVVIAQLKQQGYKIVSLESTSHSIDIRELAIAATDKICLIVGAENEGICQPLLDASDITVHIPILGHNSSMNVANACAIATFEITRSLQP